jgi:hypothetical protein
MFMIAAGTDGTIRDVGQSVGFGYLLGTLVTPKNDVSLEMQIGKFRLQIDFSWNAQKIAAEPVEISLLFSKIHHLQNLVKPKPKSKPKTSPAL